MKNVQIDVNYKLCKKKYPFHVFFFCSRLFVLLLLLLFFFSWIFNKFGKSPSISLEYPALHERNKSRWRDAEYLTDNQNIDKNSMKEVKKKHFSFNGESSVIPSLCFLGGFAFGRRIRGDMSILRFLSFFTTNTDNSIFFRTSSFHLQPQKTV